MLLAISAGIPVPAYASSQNDVRQWLSLRDSKRSHDFSTYARFLKSHPEWPESGTITLRAEQALLAQGADSSTLLDWFAQYKPVTDEAALRYVRALAANNRNTQAATYLREKWRSGAFNEDQQVFIKEHLWKWLDSSDHEERLSNLIWAAKLDRAERAMSYVGNTHARTAGAARIALQRGSSRGLSMMESLSATARLDNGVIFDLARYYRQKGQDSKAISVLARRRKDIHNHDAQWWRERNLLARRAFERGNYEQAYNIVSAHGHTSGVELAEAEWFSGWIAITRLKKPSAAYKHFDHMYRNVKTPISQSRAAYWAGIAAGQLGQQENALQWYRQAARHMNTFYGQMAAYALNQPNEYFAAFFKRSQALPTGTDSRLRGDMISAARILQNMNMPRERDAFLRAALRDAQGKDIPHLMVPVARQFKHYGIALAAAKSAYDKGILVADALFPRTDVPRHPQVDRALTLSIIRQESMFDPLATSTADARGLMQILPTTASHVAKKEGIAHNNANQLYQSNHNITLGQAYLNQLLNRYDGFVPLAAAAYNAGPGNVSKWLESMGDPRRDPYSWVDWVERIPFYETRNYVQRVWENYTIYKYMDNSR